MLTRRTLLASALAATPPRRPNILLIMTDQQWAGALGAAGNPYLKTPNLDRLAREGARFANSWCTSPVCSPARSGIVTGCLPHRTRVIYNGQRLNPEVPTLAEVFRAAGYDAAWVGKWHLAPDRGFDMLPFPVAQPSQLAYGEFTDAPVADTASAFLRRQHDRPFVLGVSFLNPHDICYWIVNKHAETPDRDLPPLPANFAIDPHESEFITRCRRRTYYGDENTATANWTALDWRRYLYAYYRLVEQSDRYLGQVLDALRDAGLEDDTIVVFTADHGEGMAAHHWVVKLMLYQETLSVPLILRYKNKVPAGHVDRNTLASGMDILPTLCDLAQVAAPAGIQGQSLFSNPRRDSVFAELAPDTKDHALEAHAVRTHRLKYISFSTGANPELLFDLAKDPGETRNLAAQNPRELNRHRALLQTWLQNSLVGQAVSPVSPSANPPHEDI